MKFSCIALLKHTFEDPKRIPKFEERVLFVSAQSEEDAEKLFSADINEFAGEEVELLEKEISEMYPEDGAVVEVASSMKIFAGANQEYIERFWDDQKPITCDTVGWSHVRFRRSELVYGCYNCQQEFESDS